MSACSTGRPANPCSSRRAGPGADNAATDDEQVEMVVGERPERHARDSPGRLLAAWRLRPGLVQRRLRPRPGPCPSVPDCAFMVATGQARRRRS
jgi:hypothetical protein